MDDKNKQPKIPDKTNKGDEKELVLDSITDPQALNIVQTIPKQPGFNDGVVVNPTNSTPKVSVKNITAPEVKPNIVQNKPAEVKTAAQVGTGATVPLNKKIMPKETPKGPIKFSAYSEALRTYNKKVSFEKVTLSIIVLALAGVIYYYGFYHPIGLYSSFLVIIRGVVHLVHL